MRTKDITTFPIKEQREKSEKFNSLLLHGTEAKIKFLRVSDNQSKISLNKILTTLHICIYEGGES